MKKLLSISLTAFLLLGGSSLYGSCKDVKKRPATSSRKKFMGIPGNESGQHCPDKELFWLRRGKRATDLCFARGKQPADSIENGVLAVFSPDCSAFWVAGKSAGGNLRVIDTTTGKALLTMTGSHPAWSADSKSLYFFSSGNQLSYREVLAPVSRPLLTVSDYVACRSKGKGAIFNPVKRISETELQWEYPISSIPIAGQPGTVAGKRITFHAVSGEITNTEEGGVSCGP